MGDFLYRYHILKLNQYQLDNEIKFLSLISPKEAETIIKIFLFTDDTLVHISVHITLKEMFKFQFLSHKKNENQNYSEISPYTSQNG